MDGFAEFYSLGGVFMHGITVIGLVGFVVLAERTWNLVLLQRWGGRPTFSVIKGKLLQADFASALAASAGRGAVARVVRTGLMAGTDPQRTRAAVEEERAASISLLTRCIPTLGSLANLAGLIGLLGTVDGMVGGFRCPATVSADQRAAAIAMELSVALNTTGFGLVVALILRAAQTWLRARADAVVAEVELYGARVANLITVATEPAPCSRAAPYRVEPLPPW